MGGATGTMIVRNVGRACRVVNFTVPEQRIATSRLEVVRAPAQGRLEVIQPNVVAYTPNAGYTGPDEFHYGGSGPGREGRILPVQRADLGPRGGTGRAPALAAGFSAIRLGADRRGDRGPRARPGAGRARAPR